MLVSSSWLIPIFHLTLQLQTFTHALYHLAANPEIAGTLREEVQALVEEDGWKTSVISRMHKVDSFLRESLRYNGIASSMSLSLLVLPVRPAVTNASNHSVVLMRKVLKDFHFSDGSFAPAGTIVVAPTHATHYNDEFLPDAKMFNPWRFSDMRKEFGESKNYRLVNPSNTYIPFGLGKHAW